MKTIDYTKPLSGEREADAQRMVRENHNKVTIEYARKTVVETMGRLEKMFPIHTAELVAPTAPLPTVAPHLAGLVERLEKAYYEVDLARLEAFDADNTEREAWYMRLRNNLTDAIAALTQLVPLAGEAERLNQITTERAIYDCELKRVVATPKADMEKLTRADIFSHHTDDDHFVHIEVAQQLEAKLAASERECVRLKEENERLGSLRSELAEENAAFAKTQDALENLLLRDADLRTQLAAAERDADALAGALEFQRDALMRVRDKQNCNVSHDDLTQGIAHCQGALAAHRARGAAGGKAT